MDSITGWLAWLIVCGVTPLLWLRLRHFVYINFFYDINNDEERERYRQEKLAKIPYFSTFFGSYVIHIVLGYLMSDAEARNIGNDTTALHELALVPHSFLEQLLSSFMFS